ncbi:flagellar FlbD family protein [Caproiciproducens galactitolivorans]|uniref:Flagellar FlbD family protein n=1 Tax=Caproiciproducens galactitolivorans TaxID=642589 RepID=A0ABT4BQ66_9FIRM|nr:flagellar FlbD family protein [Caproiciproducens galactitolivorans]MCY1713034.1 flagellar FlbD family protein [Caproiciproducens galactitolivorans]
MINVTNLNGTSFVVNSNLIETIECIPETKITLTTGKYYLVSENSEEIIKKIILYNREIFKNTVKLKN